MPRHAVHIAVAIIPLWVATIACASDAVPAAAAGVPEGPKIPRMVVLRNGKVIEGRFRLAQGGYEVDSAGGRVFVADSFIWFTAEGRLDAYKTIRERIPETTPNGHVRIAQWCVENRLTAQAVEQLGFALRLEPDHADARSMLRLLEAGSDPSNGASGSAAPRSPSLEEEVPTLGGLPPESAREFVSRVQPILVNRCGNASCHGTASQNAFTLRNVRAGNPAYRTLTIQNLDAVLDQLSAEQPGTSPLLVRPQQPGHGGSHKPLFAGPAGATQLRTIAAWVATVAQSVPKSLPSEAAEAEIGSLLLTSGESEPTSNAPVPKSDDDQKDSPVATADDADPTAALLERVIAEERPDAFDPNEFNRRFAPRTDGSPLPSSDGPTR